MNRIILATDDDKIEILKLYRTHLYGPADWSENYPNEDTIEFDISRDSLYVMKNELDEIIATISIDQDEEVEALECWNKKLVPGAELSRLCVREDLFGNGIAKEMMRFVFDVLRSKGKKSVHILVKTGHVRAIQSYSTLGFVQVGACTLFEKSFVCMEIEL